MYKSGDLVYDADGNTGKLIPHCDSDECNAFIFNDIIVNKYGMHRTPSGGAKHIIKGHVNV